MLVDVGVLAARTGHRSPDYRVMFPLRSPSEIDLAGICTFLSAVIVLVCTWLWTCLLLSSCTARLLYITVRDRVIVVSSSWLSSLPVSELRPYVLRLADSPRFGVALRVGV